MSVKARAEKNFRRASPKPARRKGKRRWISWRVARLLVSVLLVVYAIYRAFDLVVSASTLQVRHIVVHGNVQLSAGEVQALVDGLRGTSILTADLASFRRRLLKSPWVADVALRRVLPSTIEVFVRERRPMGRALLGSQLYLIDRQGTVIDEFGPQYASSTCQSSTAWCARRARMNRRWTSGGRSWRRGSLMRWRSGRISPSGSRRST